MKTLRILYHMARADFLERTRRYSFLVMLVLVLYLGFSVNAGQISLRLDDYRGLFNSAWVGSMMTLVVNFFLGWFGFYLVKGSIARDYETGVGQIIATTPLSRPLYVLGKWASNVAVLSVMVLILLVCAFIFQLIQREVAQIDLWALSAPFLIVALPCMALVAALTTLFESISWLRGGFGNVLYFFLFVGLIAVIGITMGERYPLLDWMGFNLFSDSMSEALRVVYPAYEGGFALGMVPGGELQTFQWDGVRWTLDIVALRLVTFCLSLSMALLGALFFDRFDPSRQRVRRARQPETESPASAPSEAVPAPLPHLGRLESGPVSGRFAGLLIAELRLLLKGLPWWWYAGAAGLILSTLIAPLAELRTVALPLALIWPTLLWSQLGCREARHSTGHFVFASPRLLGRQFPAMWLSGLLLSLLMGAGGALRLLAAGEFSALWPLLVGLFFIPSMALALGVWSGSSKPFEVIYLLLWYLGPLNRVLELDYLGVHTPDLWPVYLILSLALLAFAFVGRRRQMLAN